MKLCTVIDFLEKIAPKELAEDWDNVGLLIGRTNDEIDKILVCLDFSETVLNEAIEKNCQMIITHHPVIFKPLSNITNPLLLKAISHNICVYSAHTNLDLADGGVNFALSSKLELKDVKSDGILRFGTLEKTMTASEFKEFVKDKLNVKALRVNNIEKPIKTVGVDFLDIASTNNCDAFVTGEASYHTAQNAENSGILLIAAGHFETEALVVPVLKERMEKEFPCLEIIEGTLVNPYTIS